ncbi:MAG: hypothetical protein LBE99_01135, partial [Puniceicoccales bacterium]|nr:hypothetical protein [Puniceicoccales bacterium]
MLNMKYYDTFQEIPPIADFYVWKHLRNHGYKIWTSIGFISLPDYPKTAVRLKDSRQAKNLFIISCFDHTPIKHMIHNMFMHQVYGAHIQDIDTTLTFLENAQQDYGLENQYFYAHIVSPHEPFVFDEEGNVSSEQTYEGFVLQKKLNLANDDVSETSFKRKYVNQIKAINKRILNTIHTILAQYPTDKRPIIILHG